MNILDTTAPLDDRALAVQDRVVAALREAQRPLTTSEVCVLAGPRLTPRDHRNYRHLEGRGRVWSLVACFDAVDGSEVDVIAEILEVDRWGYQLLLRCERFGYVRRAYDRSCQSVVWWLVAGRREWDSEVDALDALVAESVDPL